ncbi:MAG: DNA-binding transcriptional regulator OxyR [Coxiella endosymbiont of Dermacentor nuttalli]
MNLRDLEYLIALSAHCHFGKAAKACFVSQPALSMQIKKLEEDLGIPLIERTNKKVFLTEMGEKITEKARSIILQVDAMQEIAAQAKNPFRGELHLGIIPTVGPYLLPHIIPDLIKTFPDLMLYLREEKTTTLIEKLIQGKLNAVLLAIPLIEKEDLEILPLFEEEFFLALPRHHTLAKHKMLTLSDLENKTLLLLEEGHCLRDQTLSVCHRATTSETKSFQATSLETLRHMVAANMGMTLMPKLSCYPSDNICYLPFNSPKPMRTIGIAWRPSSTQKILLQNIITRIRKVMTQKEIVKVINTTVSCFNSSYMLK